MDAVRTVLNIIWLILAGFWLFLGYVLAGVLLCIPIITIPWAIASFRTANYVLWPFGRTIVDKPTAGVGSFLGNVIWVIFAGWWLALGHILSGIALFITVMSSVQSAAEAAGAPDAGAQGAHAAFLLAAIVSIPLLFSAFLVRKPADEGLPIPAAH